jgi:hypothetical protein
MFLIDWRIESLPELLTGSYTTIIGISKRHSVDGASSCRLLIFGVCSCFQPSSWNVVSYFKFVVVLTWFSNEVFLYVSVRSQFCPYF